MVDQILDALGSIPNELKIFIVSLLPIVELRGAIPIGAALGVDPFVCFIVAVVGNLLPVPFIILLGRHICKWLKKFKPFRKITEKVESKVEKKADKVMKNAALGLFIFVAIPLPGTGAWTGALIASLFNMRFKYALPSISLGVVTAGVIMTVGSHAIKFLIGLFA